MVFVLADTVEYLAHYAEYIYGCYHNTCAGDDGHTAVEEVGLFE